MFRATLATLALLGAAPLSGAQVADVVQSVETQNLFSGTWENDRGSGVTFTVTNGLLSGYYQTALGEPDKSKQFALTGFAEGDQITFTVNFKGFGSLTSWTGQMTQDAQGDYIRTLWNLTRDVEDSEEDDELWQSIISGASDFRRVSVAPHSVPQESQPQRSAE